ncbi:MULTISPECIES: hypothetical protein [Streptococcus]|nr:MULTISPECIES: hypothetical protein [Streptococcus]MCW0948196.1 hypothetical protein [Streptococcus anginosus]MCW0994016.1 hypothetical protein [Streptococcus anginosus]MCW1016918.1 hypothetical protein [Streptococcus anginosus]MCW1024744.1 hypothetical protein [Streptococcus anginosus]
MILVVFQKIVITDYWYHGGRSSPMIPLVTFEKVGQLVFTS